ncbi:MAG: PaaI family thioesterase [Ilumatobacteraceae bacterium]
MSAVPPDTSTGWRADQFEELPPEQTERWLRLGANGNPDLFPAVLGFVYTEIRRDYARLELPFRPQLRQAAGVVHGGVIAALIDAVVVPAIGAVYETQPRFVTLDLSTQYLGAVVDEDMVAEGWVLRRGRSIVFCEAEVVAGGDRRLVARGQLTYKVG